MSSECQTVWIQIRPDILSGPIWVQHVCKSFCRLAAFFKINFFKKFFHECIRVSNSLIPDQARLIVGPDQGPNCLQKFFVVCCIFFSKLTFSKNSFLNAIRVSKSSDSDLGSNCLQFFFVVRWLFSKLTFSKNSFMNVIRVSVWIQIRSDISSSLIWVQTVFKSFLLSAAFFQN